jgi:hypothetical protein
VRAQRSDSTCPIADFSLRRRRLVTRATARFSKHPGRATGVLGNYLVPGNSAHDSCRFDVGGHSDGDRIGFCGVVRVKPLQLCHPNSVRLLPNQHRRRPCPVQQRARRKTCGNVPNRGSIIRFGCAKSYERRCGRTNHLGLSRSAGALPASWHTQHWSIWWERPSARSSNSGSCHSAKVGLVPLTHLMVVLAVPTDAHARVEGY